MKQNTAIARRSAASRKAWRTRKRMKQARDIGPRAIDPDQKQQWPAYMRRALPCPEYGT